MRNLKPLAPRDPTLLFSGSGSSVGGTEFRGGSRGSSTPPTPCYIDTSVVEPDPPFKRRFQLNLTRKAKRKKLVLVLLMNFDRFRKINMIQKRFFLIITFSEFKLTNFSV